MNMRASGANELRKFSERCIGLRYQIISASVLYNQCSFLLLHGMALCTNDRIYRQNTNVVKIYVHASERA